ncbi:hypothetical protein VNI00_017528 [Paramarasmius palmivorus]|uniref:Uncharacterized protein n=1 Tax=Paramarasmius palmivorus TaxID=297713 RepID=A0AAW0B673_9AGAR
MPRTKIYCSRRAKKEAERAKSARHYEKNRDAILARKRELRKAQKERQRLSEQTVRIAKREERQATEEKQHTKEVKQAAWASGYEDAVGKLRRLEHGLNKETGSCVSRHLDNICTAVLAWYQSSRTSDSPLDYHQLVFTAMQGGIDRVSSDILRQFGSGFQKEWQRSQTLSRRVTRILCCLDGMSMGVMGEDLDELYQARRLRHQRQPWRNWVDGKGLDKEVTEEDMNMY